MNESVLTRIASGDVHAVDDCVDRYGSLVWSLAKRMMGNAADAEDAVQEIFVELWQQADRFDPAVAGEPTFVAMIARRRLIDRIRKDSRRPTTEAIDREPIDASEQGTAGEVVWSDEAAKAKRCLGKLPSVQQQVLTLAVHEGQSHSTIARHLSLPLGTVKSYARRGLIQLRDCMKRPLQDAPNREITRTAVQGSRS